MLRTIVFYVLKILYLIVRCGSFGRCEDVIFKGAGNEEHKR